MFARKTRKMNSDLGIAVLEEVEIGKVKQTILIRGEDIHNPIMLFLHGGPGTAQIGFAPKFQGELEKEFTVVNWDQRGSGLSYSTELKKEDLLIEQFVSDTIELITYLLEKFKQPKLFLVGHSWGTVLGILVSQKSPELLYSYIGIGQVVNMKEGEKISYEYTIRKAQELNKKKAIKQLANYDINDLKTLDIQRKWLTEFGGSYINVSMYNLIYSNMIFAKEYTFRDWMNYMKAGKSSLHALWDQMLEIDFLTTATELQVPVYLLTGKHDYQTPFSLAERYYDKLQCPYKELIWFEKSGHLLNYEETNKFNYVCIEIKKEQCIVV
ncbi:alpha/beta hydrolase [Anaerobacillus alkaliphilus]|uniref:Alpha/beta hydrolase n=1 Tax=Anaerobacillus alkaliphilus TaxID=1548597 RepID=A0A4Q0VT28_9BACI|nr:alpha/beta hydrolase [Anaerobacillus alkaliphilus]RXI98580.1 alpha/beta hydrolase [Anaerobacillus alkaliphilus]